VGEGFGCWIVLNLVLDIIGVMRWQYKVTLFLLVMSHVVFLAWRLIIKAIRVIIQMGIWRQHLQEYTRGYGIILSNG